MDCVVDAPRDFTPERTGQANVYEAVAAQIAELRKARKRVVLASYSKGSRDRLQGLLADHGLKRIALADNWQEALGASKERSEEHTSELQSLMRISYAVFCLKKKTNNYIPYQTQQQHDTSH